MTLDIKKYISEDGKTLHIVDNTEYPSEGVERNDIALVSVAKYKKSSGDVIMSPGAYQGESVTSFAFDVENNDGVYEVKVFPIPVYVEQSLETGDIVYVVADHKIKKYDGSALSEVTDQSLLDESIDDTATVYAFVISSASISKDELLLIYMDKLEDSDANCCEWNDVVKAKRNFDYVRTLIWASIVEFCRTNYTTAQTKIEAANSFADSILSTVS